MSGLIHSPFFCSGGSQKSYVILMGVMPNAYYWWQGGREGGQKTPKTCLRNTWMFPKQKQRSDKFLWQIMSLIFVTDSPFGLGLFLTFDLFELCNARLAEVGRGCTCAMCPSKFCRYRIRYCIVDTAIQIGIWDVYYTFHEKFSVFHLFTIFVIEWSINTMLPEWVFWKFLKMFYVFTSIPTMLENKY